MILEAETYIRASPEEIFSFFEEIEQNYEAWHPEHITFQWVVGERPKEGNRAYFEEEIGGELMKKTVRYSAVESNRSIELQPTSHLLRFFIPFISFTVEPEDDECRFTQRLKIRTGPLGKRLNRDEFEAVHQHMKEEGENLKSILEGGQESAEPCNR